MTERRSSSGWIPDIVVGGLAGGAAGAVLAVNLVIFSGIEPGYQASIPEVFEQNFLIGVLTLILLIGGPVAGVVIARRLRSKRG